MKDPYFIVGMHKGEMDFEVSGAIGNLSYEKMRDLREMIVVGIGVCESTWQTAQERANSPYQSIDVKP